jgi:hypothetical protein
MFSGNGADNDQPLGSSARTPEETKTTSTSQPPLPPTQTAGFWIAVAGLGAITAIVRGAIWLALVSADLTKAPVVAV